jgi:ligand-binding SRPBCC domain-containing protein
MPQIHLTTFIAAPVERVFDLSRSINLHMVSMRHTAEKAIAGRVSGLIEQDETVSWQAKHLFKTRYLTVNITVMQPYHFFEDEMLNGDFASMKHQHHFKSVANGTIMIDVFDFESPYGKVGRLVNKIFLTGYMKKLLESRNAVIKDYAESDKWKAVLL